MSSANGTGSLHRFSAFMDAKPRYPHAFVERLCHAPRRRHVLRASDDDSALDRLVLLVDGHEPAAVQGEAANGPEPRQRGGQDVDVPEAFLAVARLGEELGHQIDDVELAEGDVGDPVEEEREVLRDREPGDVRSLVVTRKRHEQPRVLEHEGTRIGVDVSTKPRSGMEVERQAFP